MENLLLKTLVFTYGASSFISLIAYWPTIKDLYLHKKPCANIASFFMWSSTSGIEFFYALFILPDTLLRVVSGINFFACLMVLYLSFNVKRSSS
ncbi:MAG: hypothetical protein KDD18_08725 [Mangrovimonas sp.]|nr:hypothetical protein [Mangrovimonas sp.]MCB0433069.1 hypothetical protein [Mangrovimonas sp.]MCB0436036.1 hypothetical protein [Mangrovimonas sp.]MCB0469197.1 hypothetical protein [Flavobacteriaceae bacterium]